MRHRVSLLLGKRRKSVIVLAGCSILSGFTEAGTLALIAQIASTLVTGSKVVHFDHAFIHVSATLGTLILFTGIPPLEAQMLRSRGERYRDYQTRTSMFFPLPPQKGAI